MVGTVSLGNFVPQRSVRADPWQPQNPRQINGNNQQLINAFSKQYKTVTVYFAVSDVSVSHYLTLTLSLNLNPKPQPQP